MAALKVSPMPSARSDVIPRRWLPRLALGVVGGLAYGLLLRPWQLHWGATDEEAGMPLPGDELLPTVRYQTTRAVGFGAPLEAVWP